MRLRILGLLNLQSRCVCDLHERLPVAANLLSYHLRVLREAGLVVATRRGRWLHYRLDGDGLAEMWARLAAAGVPIPGGAIHKDTEADRRRDAACDDKEI